MRHRKPPNRVLYGFCPANMEDLVNLVLTYEAIVDYDEALELIGNPAKVLAKYLSGGALAVEDMHDWHLAEAFILIASIAEYHGFSIRNAVASDPQLGQRLLWLDSTKSHRRGDCARFLRILDRYFWILSKNAPTIANRTIDTLANLHRLFSEHIIVPRKDFLPQIMKARKAMGNILEDAIEADMQDKKFLSLICRTNGYRLKDDYDRIWFESFCLNGQLLESSYLGVPLHLWDCDLPLIKYKYRRGALYLPKFGKKEIVWEAFSLFVPEIYIRDISDLLKVRTSKEFKNFRSEVDKIYGEMIDSPQDFPNDDSVGEYLKNKYQSQLERFALDRRPKPGTVLMRRLISEVHPIAALVIGSAEVYEELRGKYGAWKLAIATLEMKQKLLALK